MEAYAAAHVSRPRIFLVRRGTHRRSRNGTVAPLGCGAPRQGHDPVSRMQLTGFRTPCLVPHVDA
jgi:hypothetical protein